MNIDNVLAQPQSLLGRHCLIAGSEVVRVQECRDRLREAAREAGYQQVERVDASEKGFDWDGLKAVCISPGLFASRRVLDLRLGQAKLSAAAGRVMIDALQAADPDLQWIVSLPEWSRAAEREPWVQTLLKHGTVIPLWPLRANELPSWLATQARKRGLRLDREASEMLLWRTEGNLLATVMELDKLALSHPDSHWDAAGLDAYVADSARFDVFKLLDEAIYGNAAKMRRVARALKAEGEVPARMIAWICRQLQLMHELCLHLDQGGSADNWLKTRQIYAPRSTLYARAARRHSPKHWQQLWADIEYLDRLSKGRAEGSAWVALERLLLRVALNERDGQRFAA